MVQGPPGTGKSQTIVNLVADSIASRRTVLIVCQKLPALEVVRKRLVAERLESRIVMVTNVTADRTPLIKEIRSQLESLQQEDARQVQCRLREISQVESQIWQLEAEIDAHHEANHVIDPICERSYRQILGELITLDEQQARRLPGVFDLRNLFRDKSWRDVYDCEEACGSLAEEWLAANHDGNPLEATLPHSHDSATAQEFHRVLSEFSATEEDRLRIPKPLDPSGSQDCPEELEGWLTQYRSTLGNWNDAQLDDCAALVPLFRQNRRGDDYSQTLQQLLELERGRMRLPIVSNGLLEWIGTFGVSQANAIAESCEQFASAWWLAKAEESPLALIQSVLSPDACESFRSRYEHLVAVEKIRWQSVTSENNGVEVQDPERLEKWLSDFQEPITQVVTTVGGLVSRLLPLPNLVELCGRYEAILHDGMTLRQIPRAIHASLPPLSELLVRCEDRQVERISQDCALAADLWIKDSVDSRLLDGIAVFPQDKAGCVELQAAITQFVEAELTRDARMANRPKSAEPIERNAFRCWMAEHKIFIDQADETLFQDATNWQPLFRAEPGRATKAEEFRKRLKELRQQIQRLPGERVVPVLEQAVATLESRQLREVSAWIRQVSENTGGWLNWKRYSANRRLRSWFRSRGIAWSEDLPRQTDQPLRQEAERRRIQNELEPILRGLSLSLNFSDWTNVDQQVRRIAERLVAAYCICKAILAFPIAIDGKLPLNGWTRESLTECLQAQQAWLEADDATQASRSALEALRPMMSTAWIDWHERLIDGERLSAIHRGYLEVLASEIPKLTDLTAFRSRLAGCDPLTPRVLAALSPIREALAQFGAEDLAREVRHQIRDHWVSARKQALESEAPLLSEIGMEPEEGASQLCEKLARVRWLCPVVESCPASSRLRTALVSGSLSAVQDLFLRFHVGLEQSKARRASLAALSELRDRMQSGWCDACERAIRQGGSNETRMVPLHHALPGILDYMTFRAIGAQLLPEAHQAFAFLAAQRGTLETTPQVERASEIGRTIRWAFWKRKQTLTEESAPVLRQLGASSVDTYASALYRLDSARRLVQIIDACPLPRLLVPAIQSRSARNVNQTLHEFELRLLRTHAVKRSSSVLGGLQDWMKLEWIQQTQRAIDSGDSNSDQLSRLLAAVPTFSAYQLFRLRSAALRPLHVQVFAALERVRPVLMELTNDPDGRLSLTVRRLIRSEALLAWKARLERQHPAVLVNRNSLNNKLKMLQELDQRLRRSTVSGLARISQPKTSRQSMPGKTSPA